MLLNQEPRDRPDIEPADEDNLYSSQKRHYRDCIVRCPIGTQTVPRVVPTSALAPAAESPEATLSHSAPRTIKAGSTNSRK